jgi:hypothetical protein
MQDERITAIYKVDSIESFSVSKGKNYEKVVGKYKRPFLIRLLYTDYEWVENGHLYLRINFMSKDYETVYFFKDSLEESRNDLNKFIRDTLALKKGSYFYIKEKYGGTPTAKEFTSSDKIS